MFSSTIFAAYIRPRRISVPIESLVWRRLLLLLLAPTNNHALFSTAPILPRHCFQRRQCSPGLELRHQWAELRLNREDGSDSSSNALETQNNPYAHPDQGSKSGVRHGTVMELLETLYPQQSLDQRNAQSRTDGYWPYIQKGEEPPQTLTYGEFDFYFFANLLDRCCDYSDCDNTSITFTDIGSGTGRLVVAAAALFPNWTLCRGIELLPTIHEAALQTLEQHGIIDASQPPHLPQPVDSTSPTSSSVSAISPIELVCGSFQDPYVYFADSDVIFVFSSCMGDILGELAQAIGRQCKRGTIVVTTEFRLPESGWIPDFPSDPRVPSSGSFRIELLEQVDGSNDVTGGTSTAFIHKVQESLHKKTERLEPPHISLEDQALASSRLQK